MDPNQQTAQPNPQTNQTPQANQQPQPTQQLPQKKGYGKRPLWQWILLYVVLAGIIYAVIYFLFLSGGAPSLPGY